VIDVRPPNYGPPRPILLDPGAGADRCIVEFDSNPGRVIHWVVDRRYDPGNPSRLTDRLELPGLHRATADLTDEGNGRFHFEEGARSGTVVASRPNGTPLTRDEFLDVAYDAHGLQFLDIFST
jgi:hypothetical protein